MCQSKKKIESDIYLLKEVYHQPYVRKIRKLINYLDLISGKKLKTTFIRQHLFKTSWRKKDENSIIRCNIKAASIYLGYLLDAKKSINKRNFREMHIPYCSIETQNRIVIDIEKCSVIIQNENRIIEKHRKVIDEKQESIRSMILGSWDD